MDGDHLLVVFVSQSSLGRYVDNQRRLFSLKDGAQLLDVVAVDVDCSDVVQRLVAGIDSLCTVFEYQFSYHSSHYQIY